MQVSRVVLDASAAIRAEVDGDEQALDWLLRVHDGSVAGAWPEVALVELGHGILRLVRAGRLRIDPALRALARLTTAPVTVEPVAPLTLPAFHVALERGLSVYDAVYVVLAQRLGATLVTADRRLAAATENAVLLGT